VPGSSFAPEQSENMSVGRSPPSGGPSQTVPGERPTVAPGGVPNNEGKEHERHDQLQKYGGNVVGVELSGCCYELLARSLGAYGERVATTDELRGALKRAIERVPSVLEVLVTRDAVSADFTGGLAGVPDRQALRAWDEAERERLALVEFTTTEITGGRSWFRVGRRRRS
jgi:hypothetical protein